MVSDPAPDRGTSPGKWNCAAGRCAPPSKTGCGTSPGGSGCAGEQIAPPPESRRDAPIGVFDSGLGGLTAVRELRRLLPGEDIIYFGDTGRVPYGTRGADIIVRYAKQDIAFLLEQNVKYIMAACGTVSSTLPKAYTDTLPVPYTGVVQSAAEAAVRATQTGRIGVIGTPATVQSGSYHAAIAALLPAAHITATACPLFVPLVENGYFNADNAVTRMVARDYLRDIRAAGVDTLILGCTHYPLIAPILADLMGPDVTLIDPGRETAHAARKALSAAGLLREGAGGTAQYYVSDSTESFARLSDWFLGDYAGGPVTRISVDAYNVE
ncbi:MAG: glutamate racemase [Subdoligranulum sp.]|nr:glutamate racemase [Subdoligranulum sp.]